MLKNAHLSLMLTLTGLKVNPHFMEESSYLLSSKSSAKSIYTNLFSHCALMLKIFQLKPKTLSWTVCFLTSFLFKLWILNRERKEGKLSNIASILRLLASSNASSMNSIWRSYRRDPKKTFFFSLLRQKLWNYSWSCSSEEVCYVRWL